MATAGIKAPNYKSQKLKRRLLKTFPHQLSFWRPGPRNEAEIMFCSQVPKGQIVEAGIRQTPDLLGTSDDKYQEEPTNPNRVNIPELYHTAKYIRMELKKVANQMPQPPSASDLTCDQINLPCLVYNFLVWLLSSDEYDNEDEITLITYLQRLKSTEESWPLDKTYSAMCRMAEQKRPSMFHLP